MTFSNSIETACGLVRIDVLAPGSKITCKPNVSSAANHCCQLGHTLISKLLAAFVKCLKYIKSVSEKHKLMFVDTLKIQLLIPSGE